MCPLGRSRLSIRTLAVEACRSPSARLAVNTCVDCYAVSELSIVSIEPHSRRHQEIPLRGIYASAAGYVTPCHDRGEQDSRSVSKAVSLLLDGSKYHMSNGRHIPVDVRCLSTLLGISTCFDDRLTTNPSSRRTPWRTRCTCSSQRLTLHCRSRLQCQFSTR
jgi:hypothetical protein